MNLSLGVQGLQLLAWLFALIEFIIAFYVLALNARHPANRHLSVLMFLLATNNVALGLFIGAANLDRAILPSYLIAATSFVASPGVALVVVVLLRPGWLRGRWRWVWWPLYASVILLPVVTLGDYVFGTRLWYTGIDAFGYAGGYLPLHFYVSKRFYTPAMVFYGFLMGLVPFIPIVATLRDKTISRWTRQLAWMVLVSQISTLIVVVALRTVLSPVIRALIAAAIFGSMYAYAAFKQMVSERRLQRGQLRSHLPVVFLAITIPILLVSVSVVGLRARALIQQSETDRLGAIAHLLANEVGLQPEPDTADLQELVRLAVTEVGDAGVIYIVDDRNQIVVHSELQFTLVPEDDPMRDFSRQVPVAALRHGRGNELLIFRDEDGRRWWAYSSELKIMGWGVVVQQQEFVVAQGMRRFTALAGGVILVGGVLLALLSFLSIRQAFFPIISLTETAKAIAAGDLNRVAPVESEDEIGTLARAFNSVTARLNALIGDLEARVAERTADVERRAEYLAITGGVSRVAASILDVDTLLERVVHLISERFDFYHAGIFLIDEAHEWAQLRAASSEGGQRMLARAHRLRVGEQGIVGYVSGTGRPRIALDVDADVVWVQNPDLPETRSEMALPLIIGEEVIGVLDVQSTVAEAFGEEDVATLRILADQIAVAIRNAQLFEESRQTLRELQRVYGAEIRQGWAAGLSAVTGYRYTPASVEPLTTEDMKGRRAYIDVENTLAVPLQLAGGQTFGYLRLQRDAGQPWTQQEIAFINTAVQDVAQALEVSRLLEQSRRAATREQVIGEVSGRIRETLDMETMLRTAAEQMCQALGLEELVLRMVSPDAAPRVTDDVLY